MAYVSRIVWMADHEKSVRQALPFCPSLITLDEYLNNVHLQLGAELFALPPGISYLKGTYLASTPDRNHIHTSILLKLPL